MNTLHKIVVLLCCGFLLPVCHAQSGEGETMLTPRGREAYEKHLAELNAKYGANKNQSLKEAVLSANGAPDASAKQLAGTARIVLPADLVPGQKLKFELWPHGSDQFFFQDEVFDAASLEDALSEVKQRYDIAEIVLLEGDGRSVELDHILGLARIGRDLAVTTAYQQGGELKVISAQ